VSRCARRVIAIVVAACGACGKGSTTTSGASVEPHRPSGAEAPQAAAAPRPTGAAGTTTRAAPGAGSSAATAAGPPTCEQLPFAESTPVPEASGAAWLVLDGKPALLVVGDSGNHGAYGILDPETGVTLETGTLPLSDEASDDIEGVAARDGLIYGITSSGWMRVWKQTSAAAAPGPARDVHSRFELVGTPYPLGPIDLPDTKNNDRAPRGDGMVCNGRVVNCGRNYEGLCIAPVPRPGAACLGFAASKADGHLYCLTEEAGRLVVHHDRAIAIARPGVVADCAFGDDDTLWVGSNLFDLGNVYQVAHWEDPASATVERVGSLLVGFPELIAARGDVVYRMSDMGGSPSLMARYRCRRP
jgi:hypothetical protein